MKIVFALASLLLASCPHAFAADDGYSMMLDVDTLENDPAIRDGIPLLNCPEKALQKAWDNSLQGKSPSMVDCEVESALVYLQSVLISSLKIDLSDIDMTKGNEPDIQMANSAEGGGAVTNINLLSLPSLPSLSMVCAMGRCTVFVPKTVNIPLASSGRNGKMGGRGSKGSKGGMMMGMMGMMSKSSKSSSSSSCDFCCDDVCFSGHSTVDVEGKGVVLMKDLQVGDKIRTTDGEYQTVYSFMHYHETRPTEYLQIYTDSPSKGPLEISGNHMVFLADKTSVPAKLIKVGDKLSTADDSATVSKITTITRDGLYAPVTPDGTLVVNGVLASSYITFQDTGSAEIGGYKVISFQFLEHIWEMPHRVLCLGFGGSDYCRNEFHDEDGYNKWSYLGIRLIRFAEQQNELVQVIMLVLFMSIFLPLYALEMAVTTPSTFAAVLAVGGAWHYMKKNFVTTINSIKTVE